MLYEKRNRNLTEGQREAQTGDNPREEERQAYARQLHDLRGYPLRLQVSRTLKAGSISGTGFEGDRRISLRLLYCGPAGGRPEGLRPEQDPFAYTSLFSPFPAEPDRYTAQGFSGTPGETCGSGSMPRFC